MAQVQQQFEQFHEAIKLGRFEESQALREKRDIIRGKLEERLSGVFDDHDELCPPSDSATKVATRWVPGSSQ